MKPNEIKNINTNTGVVQLMDIANFGVGNRSKLPSFDIPLPCEDGDPGSLIGGWIYKRSKMHICFISCNLRYKYNYIYKYK